jgi:hypothetical protein
VRSVVNGFRFFCELKSKAHHRGNRVSQRKSHRGEL